MNALLADMADTLPDKRIAGLALDSRKVCAGDAFFALPGASRHGLAHAAEAIAAGAGALVYDPDGWHGDIDVPVDVPAVAIPALQSRLGEIAARFYGHPSAALTVIGVTGTNGKTTCTQLMAQLLPACGVIGTLGWGDAGRLAATLHTTPDAFDVQRMLHSFVAQGRQTVVMEVSSHGLQQGRVNSVGFRGAVFTNLSRDHLDYHADMDAYLAAKLVLFGNPALEFAVVNIDDRAAQSVLARLSAGVQVWTFSTRGRQQTGAGSILAENVRYQASGCLFDVLINGARYPAQTSLVGQFNLENVLAALAVGLASGLPAETAVAGLAGLRAASGRMEKFGGHGLPTVLVDYAHSPDALQKALLAARASGNLIVVFGCGGDRDRGKRPEMGRIACAAADKVIITDDNPRSETPAGIIADILSGCDQTSVVVIPDRAEAINTAIRQATADDCVLVAGKGHEQYQEANGVRQPFSDQQCVREALAAWGGQS